MIWVDKCQQCIMEKRIRDLETGQAETKIYVKEIRDDIAEVKETLNKLGEKQKSKEDAWSPIVIELIKLVSQTVLVLGAIAGATKIMGGG